MSSSSLVGRPGREWCSQPRPSMESCDSAPFTPAAPEDEDLGDLLLEYIERVGIAICPET